VVKNIPVENSAKIEMEISFYMHKEPCKWDSLVSLRSLHIQSNEFSSVNTLQERKLRAELFSAYRVYHVSTDTILEWICEV
jgi:hypothetical protein